MVTDGDWDTGDALTELRALGSWRAGPKFAVFGGPNLTFHMTEDDSGAFDSLELWTLTDGDDEIHASMWIGATLGVRFL